jgi:hypothetical protein
LFTDVLKLEPYTRAMILFVSERIQVEDNSGDIHWEVRPQPTDPYTQLLQLGNVAQAKLHLDHIIQTIHKCPVSLPIATVNAILHGRFTWSEETNPEAFSIFACFSPEPSAVDTHSDDYLALQLKSAEGQGLSDTDVSRSTKVILRVPCMEHQLAEFIGAFALLLSTLFGPHAPVHLAVQSWLAHIRENQMVYAQLIRVDTTFGSKVLALIDRAIQLYFRACLDPIRQAGAERLLMFDTYQTQIVMNTFAYTVLPAAITCLLLQSPSTGATSSSLHTNSSSTPTPVNGTPVFNMDRLPSFRVAPDLVSTLQNRVSTAPTWHHPHPPCRACPRYQSGGECVSTCPRAATHRPPRDAEIDPYLKWVNSLTRSPTPSGTSSGGQTGNNRHRQRRPNTNNNYRPSNSAPAKRHRPSSPRPANSGFTRNVHFAKDGEEGKQPDFP